MEDGTKKGIWFKEPERAGRDMTGPVPEINDLFDCVEDQTTVTQDREKNIVADIIK